MRLLAVFLAFCFLSTPALADEPKGRSITVQGVEGLWFPLSTATRMLQDLTELKSLREVQIPHLNQQIALQTETIDLLRHNLSLTEQQSEEWREALQTVVARPLPASSIWDGQVFWYFTGFLSAGLLALGLNFGLNHTAE